METLHDKKHIVQSFQVALFSGSYPEADATDDLYFAEENGIVVITQDNSADVKVVKGKFDGNDYKHLAAKEITVGDKGLTVGNVLMADTTDIQYPAGKVKVDVYVDNDEVRKAAKVVFALS
jgi:predicted NUDIX family NTP pyrophosphohydrolase